MYDELCIRLQVVCVAFTAYSAPPPFFKECLFHLNIKMQKCKKTCGAINYGCNVKSWKSVVSDMRPEEFYDVDRLHFDIY